MTVYSARIAEVLASLRLMVTWSSMLNYDGLEGASSDGSLSLDEALSDLVAVEGVVHEEGCMFLVVVVVVGDAVTSSSLGLFACCGVFLVLCWARGLESRF